MRRHVHAGLERDERLGHLAVQVIRHADDRRLGHCRVPVQDVFDLPRIHIDAVDDNHVLAAIDQIEVLLVIHPPDVARAQPAVGVKNGARLLGLSPIALHHAPATDAHLTERARWNLVPQVVHHPHLDTWNRHADRQRLAATADRIDRRHG